MSRPAVNVYRNGKLHVRATPCTHCLYGPDRIVSGARARQITQDTRSRDGASFVCHRDATHDEPQAVCRGWFDRFADEDMTYRLAKMADIIEYVRGSES